MVKRKNKPLITYWQGWVGWGREHPLIFLNILEYQTQKELFLQEAELVLSCFSLCLNILLKLWSSLSRKIHRKLRL